MMYKVEVHIPPDEWGSNMLRFHTREAAESYGLNLLMRWSVPNDYRVVEDPEAQPEDYEESGSLRPKGSSPHEMRS